MFWNRKWTIGNREIISYFDSMAEENGMKRVYGDASFEEVISSGQTANVLSVGFQEKYYTQIYPFFR